jgi:hypothetical protein
MTGAMQGSTHSLRQIIRTRRTRQRIAAVGRVTTRRYSSHAGEIALIHSDFAHRFHLAMQEVCAATRGAMMQRLSGEKEAALERLRFESADEYHVGRDERRAARNLRLQYATVRVICRKSGPRPQAKRPLRRISCGRSATPDRCENE